MLAAASDDQCGLGYGPGQGPAGFGVEVGKDHKIQAEPRPITQSGRSARPSGARSAATAPAGTLTNTVVLTPPAGGVCDGPGGACNATATTAVSAIAAVPTLGQWALLLLSVLVGLSLRVQHRREPR